MGFSTMTSIYIFSGKLAFWKLAEHFTYCRGAMIRHPDCLSDNGKQLIPQSTVFVVVVEYHITKEFYRNARHFIEKHTLAGKTELLNFSRSSLIKQTSLLKPKSGETLATLRFKYVIVDPETRKSSPLPDWFVHKYGKLIDMNESVARYVLPQVPNEEEKVYCKWYTINGSDIDHNQHTNNAVYYRLCFDAATEASLFRELFKGLTGDICNYNVRRSQGIYMKESRLGDCVEVIVWQDNISRDTLHFLIDKIQDDERKSRLPLFRTSIQFHLNQSML